MLRAALTPPLRCKRRQDAPSDAAPAFVVLDIEGTTSPMTYVADVLFPYAKKALRSHLQATWDSQETRADVAALREFVSAPPCQGSGRRGGTGLRLGAWPVGVVSGRSPISYLCLMD